jgi:hypothetical protein
VTFYFVRENRVGDAQFSPRKPYQMDERWARKCTPSAGEESPVRGILASCPRVVHVTSDDSSGQGFSRSHTPGKRNSNNRLHFDISAAVTAKLI